MTMSNPVAVKQVVVEKKPVTEAEKVQRAKAKAEKFKELADKRTGKALQYIHLIANLATPNYSYSDEQAAKIVDALQREVDFVFEAFKAKKGKEKVSFSL